jgi:hypothetical protein
MTLIQFAQYMKSLGATYAVNMDGGGSTTMWVKGQGLVNVPSDSTGERAVTNAVVVLPGADANQPTPLTPLTTTSAGAIPSSSPSLSRSLEMTDPGSTGGLMDALASGALGPQGHLPGQYMKIVRTFRSNLPR